MIDRLLTTNEWFKLKKMDLCTIENDGTIYFTQKAKKKYRVLRGRLYDLHWVGNDKSLRFLVPKFTEDHIQEVVRGGNNNIIVLTEYCFVKFWKELKSSNIFKEIEL